MLQLLLAVNAVMALWFLGLFHQGNANWQFEGSGAERGGRSVRQVRHEALSFVFLLGAVRRRRRSRGSPVVVVCATAVHLKLNFTDALN